MPELNKSTLSGFSEASFGVHLSRLIVLLLLLFAAAEPKCFLTSSLAQEATTPAPNGVAPRDLREGMTRGQELARETQAYQMDLRADHYVDLLIIKGDLNLSATVSGPQGELLGEFVSMRYEPLRVSFISSQAGRYRLEIRSLEKKDLARQYDLKMAVHGAATAEDRKAAAAVRSFAEAVKLRMDWREPALREAILKYTEALKLWQSARRQTETAEALDSIGDIYFALSENRQALNYYLQALRVGRLAHNRLNEIRELNKVGYVHVYLGQGKKALEYSTRALKYYSSARAKSPDNEDQRGEAEARNSVGEAYYSLGSPRKSTDSFNDALSLWKAARDRSGEALGHLNLGYAYSDLGDLPKARGHFGEALSLWQEIGERRGQAQALTAMGTVHTFLGEKQKALDSHAQAMDIFRALGDHQGQAVALNSIGKAYEDLNQPQTALDNYKRALQIYQERGHRDFEAVTRYYLGRVYNSLGDKPRALESYQQSLLQSRRSGQQRVTAYALSAISALAGNKQEALSQLNQVLRLYRSLEDRRGQVNTLNNIGHIYFALGDKQRALLYYKQALPLTRAASDRASEADTLYNLARAEKDDGALNDALTHIEESIKTIESLRAQIVSPELRASYFASVHKHSELYIDLLMRLDKLEPDKGFGALALQASENARARALLEILAETSGQIRQGVDAKLLERERSLQLLLSAKAAYQMRVLAGKADAAEVDETNREIRDLNIAYQEVQTQIKQQSPRYASLVQPQPLQVDDIQAELRDPGTLLLEYALGEERSYLWALTSNSVASYELPARSKIERAARDVYKLLTVRQSISDTASVNYQENVSAADSQYWKEAADLSQMLLGPVAAQLGKRRLLIVADGALQYLPFEALPAPALGSNTGLENKDQDSAPLVLDHEIVSLPSASILAVIRRGGTSNGSGEKLVAILADPVFERDDPRVRTPDNLSATTVVQAIAVDSPHRVLRNTEVLGEPTNIPRLPATRQEAEAIMAVTPAGEGMMATDFDACRAIAMSGQLGRYRIVHFATHGFINTEHPELSGIMLSLLNREGKSEDGFLQVHDVYNLDLSGAQLVVLSACRTGLGKDVKGEGLMGLTRGFMYAGSRSVVASLWKVDDHATAELMKYFYQAMFDGGLTPAAALRKAKQTMWQQERWHAPYFWAAFVLQGEYRDVIAMPQTNPTRTAVLILAVALAVLTGTVYGIRRLRKLMTRRRS
jgi:CHAT domain-containing protein